MSIWFEGNLDPTIKHLELQKQTISDQTQKITTHKQLHIKPKNKTTGGNYKQMST